MNAALPLPGARAQSPALPLPMPSSKAVRTPVSTAAHTPEHIVVSGEQRPRLSSGASVSSEPLTREHVVGSRTVTLPTVRHRKGEPVKRSRKGQAVRFTERDEFVLEFLAMYRVASAEHLAYAMSREAFATTPEAITKRLRTLMGAGYIQRWKPPQDAAPVFLCTKKGIDVTRFAGMIPAGSGDGMETSLAHALLVTGIAAAHFAGDLAGKYNLTGDEVLASEYLLKRAVALNENTVPAWSQVDADTDFLLEPEFLALPSATGANQKFRIPDLVFARHDGTLLAVEVECALKKEQVYRDILTDYSLASHMSVLYFVGNTRAHLGPLTTIRTRLLRAAEYVNLNPASSLDLKVVRASMRWASSSPSSFIEEQA